MAGQRSLTTVKFEVELFAAAESAAMDRMEKASCALSLSTSFLVLYIHFSGFGLASLGPILANPSPALRLFCRWAGHLIACTLRHPSAPTLPSVEPLEKVVPFACPS